MAQYLILIYENEAGWADATPEQFQQSLTDHMAFQDKIEPLGGKLLGSNALQPTPTATTVRGGAVTDGPFVETKEALGGYYLIEAPELDTAIAIAKECPAPGGGVEVRPVMEIDIPQ